MSKYKNEEEVLNDFAEGKINKWERNIQLGKLGKNAEYFTDDDLMCMYCDDLYLCDNRWEEDGEEQLLKCKQEKLSDELIRYEGEVNK